MAVVLILLVVAAIILYPKASEAGVYMVNKMKGGSCAASAALASYRIDYKCVDVVKSKIPLQCPRRRIDIGKNNALVTQDGETEYYEIRLPDQENPFEVAYQEPTGEIVDHIVAEEMRNCWAQFGEGEHVLFNQADPESFIDHTEGTSCFICSEINFDEDIPDSAKNGDLIKGSDSRAFLENAMPGDKEKRTYVQFFNNANTLCEAYIKRGRSGCWLMLERFFTNPSGFLDWVAKWGSKVSLGPHKKEFSPMGPMNTEKSYAVVFMRKGFDFCDKDRQNADDAEMSYFVYTIPDDELNAAGSDGACDVVLS